MSIENPDQPDQGQDPDTPAVTTPAQDQAAADAAADAAEDQAPEPDPVEPSLIGKIVTWDETDEFGYTRPKFGVVLGPHEIQEGKLDVALLHGSYDRAYDPDDLSVLGS